MLQKLQAKQARYMEAMKKGANIIDISDVDTKELKTAIITDPSVRAEIEIDILKSRYESEKTRLNSELGFVSRKFEDYIKSKEYLGVQTIKKNLENYDKQLKKAKELYPNDIPYWEEKIKNDKTYLTSYEEGLRRLENKFLEKGIDIKSFQAKKEQTEIQIAELDKKIDEELPVLREKLTAQYKAEKEEKLKNYNPTDFVSERAEENKTFFSLREEKNKNVEKETNVTSSIQEQEKTRGFRR